MPQHFPMRYTLRRLGIVLLVASFGAGAAGVLQPAGADPIRDKQAEAASIQNQIDANGWRVSALSEQYDHAQLQVQQAQQALSDADAKAAADHAAVAQIRLLVDERARIVYEQATAGESLANVDFSDASRLLAQKRYADSQARQDTKLLKLLDQQAVQLADAEASAKQAALDAAQSSERIDQVGREVQAGNEQQIAILQRVQGDLTQLVAQDEAQRSAAALGAAGARYGSGPSTGGSAPGAGSTSTSAASGTPGVGSTGVTPPSAAPTSRPSTNSPVIVGPNLPAPSSGAAVAIAFARAQLGKPYRYAAAGPGAYDCSGLTMAAWGAAGVRLPHYSGAQYAMLPHVSLHAMQPGDLIFWGPGGSQHVAIYIGGGLMIAAPTTGEVVKIEPIWGHPVGAARP
jgi:peptidoglycan DL-endopeptidase CwlO